MSHTCRPGHPGILADACERCSEQARLPMLLGLDNHKTAALWDKMVAVEHTPRGLDGGDYETTNEAIAARQFYAAAVWMERHLGVDPWQPLATLQERVRP